MVRIREVGQRGLENHEWGQCEREGLRRMRRGLKGGWRQCFFQWDEGGGQLGTGATNCDVEKEMEGERKREMGRVRERWAGRRGGWR